MKPSEVKTWISKVSEALGDLVTQGKITVGEKERLIPVVIEALLRREAIIPEEQQPPG